MADKEVDQDTGAGRSPEQHIAQRRLIGAVKRIIIRYVADHPELIAALPPSVRYGPHALCAAEYPNIVAWTGMHSSAVGALRELLKEKEVHLWGCGAIDLVFHSTQLALPLARLGRD